MPSTVHLFVFDTLADWEPGYAVAGINSPEMQREPGRYTVRTCSPGGRTVTTAGGVRIQPDVAFEDVRPDDSAMLILPGGEAWDRGEIDDVARRAGAFLSAGVPVAAICGATAGLARAGLLDDRAHTSNAREYIEASGYGGIDHYRDEAAVLDRDVITASSMAPLEFARAIFERLDLYEPEALDAWYGLFSTREAKFFYRMAELEQRRARDASA